MSQQNQSKPSTTAAEQKIDSPEGAPFMGAAAEVLSSEATMAFRDPKVVMAEFRDWIKANCKGKFFFISDNYGFDVLFISWYFHHFLGDNTFRHT